VPNSTAATGCKLLVSYTTASQGVSNVSNRAGDRLSARRRSAEQQATLHVTLPPTLLTPAEGPLSPLCPLRFPHRNGTERERQSGGKRQRLRGGKIGRAWRTARGGKPKATTRAVRFQFEPTREAEAPAGAVVPL